MNALFRVADNPTTEQEAAPADPTTAAQQRPPPRRFFFGGGGKKSKKDDNNKDGGGLSSSPAPLPTTTNNNNNIEAVGNSNNNNKPNNKKFCCWRCGDVFFFWIIPVLIMVLLLGVVVVLALSFSRWKKTDDDLPRNSGDEILEEDEDELLLQNNDFFWNDPQTVAIVACSGVAVSLALFLLYHCLVKWRQRSLLRADAVVSSLFPAQVKEQLYGMDKQRAAVGGRRYSNEGRRRNSNEDGTATEDTSEERDSSANNASDDNQQSNNNNAAVAASNGPPIAEFYQASTVLFADIAGFTKWSSGRQPADVFVFLERLYGGFDQAALAHGVFKIETIGDCYVAVAGLPEPCDDHAVKMVKFAKEMLRVFRDVQNELGDALEARDLALRTGIHSGPVTAGVLRGEKARFQLFGDTVNTTARHESSGKPGRIHLSKETANLLTEAGLKEWIRPRRTRVYAKGKGQLETYWVVTGNETTFDDAIDWMMCGTAMSSVLMSVPYKMS